MIFNSQSNKCIELNLTHKLRICNVMLSFFRVNATEDMYKQYLYCPKLVSNFHFETEENSNTLALHGTGEAKVVACKYLLKLLS